MKRRLLYFLAPLLLAALAPFLILPSDWLRDRIHARIVTELAKATGGKVTLGAFDWNWTRGEVAVRDLVIRGLEPATAQPLIRVRAARLRLSILSYLSPNADLKDLEITQPELHIITFPDGSTNWPGVKSQTQNKPFLGQFVKLAIARFVVAEGLLTWDLQKIPLNVQGEKLDLNFRYEPGAYHGFVSSRKLRLTGWRFQDAAFDLDSEVAIQPERIRFFNSHLLIGTSVVEAKGELLPVTPDWKQVKVESDFTLAGAMPDLVPLLGLPLQSVGTLEAKGHLSWEKDPLITADASGAGWAVDAGGQRFRAIAWKAPVRYEKGRVESSRFVLNWLNGSYRGRASTDFVSYDVQGTAANFRLRDLAPLIQIQAPPADTTIIGPIKITGKGPDFQALARVTLLANDAEKPFSGSLNFQYASRNRALTVEPSYLDLSGTRVDLSGDLTRGLRVSLTTRNLAALPFGQKLPFQLEPKGGEISFEGTAKGTFDRPQVQGDIELSNIVYDKHRIEYVSATIDATASLLKFEGLQSTVAGAGIAGRGELTLEEWAFNDRSKYTAQLEISEADLARLSKEAGVKLPATGVARGQVEIAGTGPKFTARGPVEIARAVVGGQALGLVKLSAGYDGNEVKIGDVRAALGGQPVQVAGGYRDDGFFTLTLSGENIPLQQLAAWKEAQPEVDGVASAHLQLAGRLVNEKPQWSRIAGDAVVRSITWSGQPLGEVTLTAQPDGNRSKVNLAGTLRGATLSGSGAVALTAGLPAGLTFQLTPTTFARFEDLLPLDDDGKRAPLPFEGGVSLQGTATGPLEEPRKWKGTLRGDQLTIAAREAPASIKRDFTIRNTGPIEMEFDERGLTFKTAHLESRETNLRAEGLLAWNEKTAWNLRLTGQVNLGVLSSFQPDLNASGKSSLDAVIRGTRNEPQLNGRLIFSDASFFLRDVANGLENVSGRILFDKSRARVESFTAESGGGRIAMSGFVSFGAELGYQLQVRVDNVRVRYPAGVSTAVNAQLGLTGSRVRSLLSGALTIVRANISPQTDIGTLLTESQKPSAPVRIENEFLRGLQFDIKVDTAQDAELTTSLTQNVQAEMNFRVRGTPARPAVLGRLAFTQGELNFFGTKYLIDRGEVNFFNPTKIEPVINFDLQTRVRGVLVTLTFAGPASKINLSYRSDPPLQPNEIVALLAVGRTPTGGIVGAGSSVQNPGVLSGSATALLGQAATTPITGRLQRLFGLRSLRIDPQITGLENTAQARLTLEQQVSRDVVVTFITNLNRTQQQIVSVEWDFSREWSAIAVRDENGVFGMDFYYRKRFK